MEQGLITCPNCGQKFELSDAITVNIREHLKTEMLQDIKRREAEVADRLKALQHQETEITKTRETLDAQIEERLKERLTEVEQKAGKKAERKYAEQLKELEETLKEREDVIALFREQERELRKKQRELDSAREAIEPEISRRLDGEREKLRQEASKKLETQYEDQMKELKENLEQRDKAIKEFRQQEIDLRKRQRELEEAKEAIELEITRKLDEERTKIREEEAKKMAENHRLKDLEKDKVINNLKCSLEDMKRKAEQGSMEVQGEVLEQDLEAQLRIIFPHDNFQPVPKGIRGAVLIQTIRTPLGIECGILLWEMKNTKAWNAQWIPKLKDDMIDIRATIAILVSVVLPAGLEYFGQVDGVWVSNPRSAIPLAIAMREQIIAVGRERAASVSKNEKMEALYQYLAGTEFKQKIEGIVEAFISMQDQLHQERRAMEKHWKQREKQIQRVVKNTVGLYGDMQGIIGGQIPTIPALELSGVISRQLPDSSDLVRDREENENSEQ